MQKKKVDNMKMVPFYGTVYKSSLYDLIIPFPACGSGAEREKDVRLFLRPGRPDVASISPDGNNS